MEDPFSTPVAPSTSLIPTVDNYVCISKSAIVRLIKRIPFENIYLPRSVVTDDESTTVNFIEEMTKELSKALITHSPPRTSPKKLISSSFSGIDMQSAPQEQDTPTKPRYKAEEPSSSKFFTGLTPETQFHSIPQEIGHSEHDEEAVRMRKQEAIKQINEEMESERLGNSTFIAMTLTYSGSKVPIQRAIPPPPHPIIWDHPPPDFQNEDPELVAKRRAAVKLINLEEDPYYIARLARKGNQRHPLVWIRGTVHACPDDEGKLPRGFDREYYHVEGLAMVDTGNGDLTTICQEFLGIQLDRRAAVDLKFEYLPPSLNN